MTRKANSPTALTVRPPRSKAKIAAAERESQITHKGATSGLEAFEQAMGGRSELVQLLSTLTLAPKQQYLAQLLSDPARRGDTLARLAKDAGLPYGQVIALWREAAFQKAQALAMGRMAERLPAVVDDVVSKSIDAIIICPDCRGEPLPTGPCLRCRDKGTILRESDLDRQKLIWEATGLLKKGPGISVQVDQRVGVVAPGAIFSRFVADSDHVVYSVEAADAKTKG